MQGQANMPLVPVVPLKMFCAEGQQQTCSEFATAQAKHCCKAKQVPLSPFDLNTLLNFLCAAGQ